MKGFLEDNIKTFLGIGLTAILVIVVSSLLGITPEDVFGKGIIYEEKTVETGTTLYEDQDEETKQQLYIDENPEGEELTYERFLADPPEYDGEHLYVAVNRNRPFFTAEEKKNTETFYSYSELDERGRTGVAFANVTYDSFPEGIRKGDLSTITPAGWNQANVKERYNVMLKVKDGLETEYLWARCHVIAFALGGEELDPRNVMTGTLSFNMAMRQYEVAVADFLDTCQQDHVLYRVTPIYKDNELIPRGCLIEGYGVESKGIFIDFCQYVFNAQPGFEIDYTTGDIRLSNN